VNRTTRRALAVAVLALGIVTWLAGAAERIAPSKELVATVGPLPIAREDFEHRAAAGRAEFEKRRGQRLEGELQAILDRQILESLIRANLLVLEAKRTGIRVTDAEAEAQLRNDPFFNPGGRFDPSRFQGVRTTDPEGFRQALERTRAEAGGRKLAEQLQRKYRPEDERTRRLAERSMSSAVIEYLMLPRFDFGGDYQEPSEAAVLARYRAQSAEHQKPARAVLSIVRVENAGHASARQRADSALTALRAGGNFDDLGAAFGGVQGGVVVLAGNFPGYWRGDARLSESIFQKTPGTVVPDPVPADHGVLIVRVDQAERAHAASLRELAGDIRGALREEARVQFEERELRTLYEAQKDSMKGPAWRVRYAVADTGQLDIGRPSTAELDRFYRLHLADYTSYDAATAAIAVRPLEEVRDELIVRWNRERRMLLAKSLTDGWIEAWGRGVRDRNLERSATLLRDVGPLPEGALLDTGLAGRALSDTLARRGMALGVGLLPFARGLIVYHVYERTPDRIPAFDEVKQPLTMRYRQQRMNEYERLARERFERDPQQYAVGNLLHFSRIDFEPMSIVDVPLTRAEVERYHREHIDKYSVAEQIRARHILITPEGQGREADEKARREAEDLLQRIRAGEDFARLAERYSDDPPTRARGGDLGFFSHGAMLEPFERAAFAMKPGEVSEPVKTEVGYHLIQVLEHEPMQAEPLVTLYSNVGADAATEKAQRIATRMADSVYQLVRTPAQAIAAARRLGYGPASFTHEIGSTRYPEHLRSAMARLETVPIGKLYPGVVSMKSAGAAIIWPDSIAPPRTPEWEEARSLALEAFIRDASLKGVESKRAELDSLLSAGWSFDSVGALWGGLVRTESLKPGGKLRGLGEQPAIDSLVFGGRRAPVLANGQMSQWLDLPQGLVKVRLVEKKGPSPSQLATRIESERRLGLERNLYYYYEDLKKRHAVRILDPRLRDVLLPPPPPENAGF
jgi:parvulin-like peptidyl-prolyl isomerase